MKIKYIYFLIGFGLLFLLVGILTTRLTTPYCGNKCGQKMYTAGSLKWSSDALLPNNPAPFVIIWDYPLIVSETSVIDFKANWFYLPIKPDGTFTVTYIIPETRYGFYPANIKVNPGPAPIVTGCKLFYDLSADSPTLKIVPPGPIEYAQPSTDDEQWVWVSEAGRLGAHSILFTVDVKKRCDDKDETITIGHFTYTARIEVKNWLGLSFKQVKIIGVFAYILGPLLTLPGSVAFLLMIYPRLAKPIKENSKKIIIKKTTKK
jgi:hypothetical protein